MTPRPMATSWASRISLVTLLTVVFGCGVLVNKLDVVQAAVTSLAGRIDGLVGRVAALELWRAAHDAAGERRRR